MMRPDEHARITLRWGTGVDDELIARIERFLAELPRRFDGLKVQLPRDARRVDIVLTATSITLAERALDAAASIREEALSIGLLTHLDVDVVSGAPGSSAPNLPEGRPGDLHVGRALAQRLPDARWNDLAERGGVLVYPRSSSDSPPHRLPRRFVRAGFDRVEDGALREGLLEPDRVPGARPLEALWREFGPRVVVVGEPWVGKTHCAGALYDDQKRRLGPDRVFYLDASAHDHPLDASAWASWCAAGVEGYVVADGLDEAHFRGADLRAILSPILDARWRDRLRALVFTRDDASYGEVSRVLSQATTVRLLPVDRIEAGRDLGGERLASAIQNASQFAVGGALSIERLRALANADGVLALDDELLLRSLCQEGLRDHLVTRDDLIVARRMAAVSLVSAVDSFALQSPDPLTALITQDRGESVRALRRSALFVGVAGGYAFRSRHARDLFAANALRGVRGASTARSLLTDESGRLRSGIEEVVADLRRVEPPEWISELEAWEDSPLPVLSEQEALAVLDELLAHPGAPLRYQPGSEFLERLDCSPVRERALSILRDASESGSRRLRMFELAATLEWTELTTIVETLATSDREDPSLRYEAVLALDQDHMPALIQFVDMETPDEATSALREVILSRLVAADALPALEAAARVTGDSRRSGLPHVLAQKLTDAELAQLLGRLTDRLANEAPRIERRMLDALFNYESHRIAEIPWDGAVATDVATLLKRHRILDVRFDPSDAAAASKRRLLYAAMLDSPMGYVASNALTDDDDDWLLELASARSGLEARLAGDLRQALWRLADEDHRRPIIEAVLREKAPETWAEYEETVRQQPERRAREARRTRERAEREAAAAAGTRALADVLDEALELEPASRLRGLAELCFVDNAPSFSNVAGRFADLPVDQRRRIITEVRSLLAQAEPSAVPQGSTFSSHVLADAAAFREAVLWDDDDAWLTGSMVRGWLPLVLFDARFQRTGPARGVIERCLREHAERTLEVLRAAFEREVRASSVGIARAVPEAAWPLLAYAVSSIIEDDTYPVAGRVGLLAELLDSPSVRLDLLPVLRRQARSESPLRIEAIAGLVVLVPDEGVRLSVEIASDRDTLARALRHLMDRARYRAGAIHDLLASVTTPVLTSLAASLFRHVPYEDPHPIGIGYSPTDLHRLYDLRREVVPLLVSREDFQGPEPLIDALADPGRASDLRWHFEWVRNRGHLARLLDGLRLSSVRPKPQFVLEAIEGGHRARFRSDADLLYVLARGLRERAAETLDHVQLLRGTNRQGGALRDDWPHEHSLQTYVELRVREILRIAGSPLVLPREPQERAGRDRLDFLCVAVAHDDDQSKLIELPIEVKWSDNGEWRTGLTSQLGRRYVLDKGRRRGLYVVGFTGEGKTASQRDIGDLRTALMEAKLAFEQEHPGTELEVVVLPCVVT